MRLPCIAQCKKESTFQYENIVAGNIRKRDRLKSLIKGAEEELATLMSQEGQRELEALEAILMIAPGDFEAYEAAIAARRV